MTNIYKFNSVAAGVGMGMIEALLLASPPGNDPISTTTIRTKSADLPDGTSFVNQTVTDVAYTDSQGNVLGHLYLMGNPLGLGGGPTSPITSFWETNKDDVVTSQWTGLAALTGAQFLAKFVNFTDNRVLYHDLVALTDGGTTVQGSWDTERIDLGSGADIVKSFGGDDRIYKLDSGSLNLNGGSGIDSLSFTPRLPDHFDNPFTQKMVVNLAAGTGKNPYGGNLTLTNVENVVGTSAADLIIGDKKANVIGDGFFDGGADTVRAGGGNDVVLVTDLDLARADGGMGYDQLVFFDNIDLADPGTAARYQNFELFTLSSIFLGSAGFSLGGNTDANYFIAGDGVDTLTGRGGNDTLNGGLNQFGASVGADIAVYSGNRANYTITKQGGTITITDKRPGSPDGTDTLYNIETLRFADKDLSLATLFPNLGSVFTLDPYSGSTSDLTDRDDSYYGTDGNDFLAAKGGNNLLVGGLGDDSYYVSTGHDKIVELAGEGTDTVFVASDATLTSVSIANAANVENLTNSSQNAVTLTGNALANLIIAGNSGDTIFGGAGNDTLIGGHSSLSSGGNGDDRFVSYISGFSNDTMTGGNGADTFVFTALITSAPTLAQPLITDFRGDLGDRIDLSAIDAIAGGANDAFVWRGANAFTGEGQVRLAHHGGNTFIEINVTGTDTAEAQIELTGNLTIQEAYLML